MHREYKLQEKAIDADDIFQITWIKLMKACARFVETIPFELYLFKIAKNCILDEYRKERTRTHLIDDTHSSSEQDITTHRHSIDLKSEALSLVIESEKKEKYYKMLDALPFDQREAFVLKVLGKKIDEIVKITGVNKETVKSRLRYATKKLKSMLQDELKQDS